MWDRRRRDNSPAATGQLLRWCLLAWPGLWLVPAGCGTAPEGQTTAGGQHAETTTTPQAQPVPASLDDIPAVSADEIQLTIEPESPARYHRVSRGESLSGIARQHQTSVEALQKLNGLDDPGFLEPGQQLRLP